MKTLLLSLGVAAVLALCACGEKASSGSSAAKDRDGVVPNDLGRDANRTRDRSPR